MYLIEFINVTKTYRKHFWTKPVFAVDNLSFSVESNRITGFIGPNGAGKTTSLKMLLGLVRPDCGTIKINGRNASDPCVRTGIAYLSEQPYFYEHLTVEESLQFVYRLLRLSLAGERSEIDRVLNVVELAHTKGRKVKELSKGMQQRLNMAQALLGRPQICIFDEPMSGLDPLGRRLFREILRQLVADGASIFFSTHIIEDVETLCDSIIVLSKGKLIYQGTISAIIEEGYLGTEITVPSIDQECVCELAVAGCEITKTRQGHTVIFVPKGKDASGILRTLQTRGIYCTSMVRRNRSLESILYLDKNPYDAKALQTHPAGGDTR